MPVALSALTAADVGLPAPNSVSAAVPLFFVAVLLWRRKLPRVAALLGLLAGTGLSGGWLKTAIDFVLHWTTWLVNLVTTTTVGGVVPGALALLMCIYYVLELSVDAATFERLLGGGGHRFASRRRPHAGRSRVGGGYALALRDTGDSGRRGRPEKLGALAVGTALPSVAATIGGNAGVAVSSSINLVGGLLAGLLKITVGLG